MKKKYLNENREMIESLLENICEKVGRQHGSFPNIEKIWRLLEMFEVNFKWKKRVTL